MHHKTVVDYHSVIYLTPAPTQKKKETTLEISGNIKVTLCSLCELGLSPGKKWKTFYKNRVK